MGIKWNSPEFWAAFKPGWDWAAMDSTNLPYIYISKPGRNDVVWTNGGASFLLVIFDLKDLPPAEQWESSLIRRPRTWRVPDENTPIDAEVFVREQQGAPWIKRHFAGENRTWNSGYTSWSTKHRTSSWYQIVLADPDNPDLMPPLDWKP